jgi:DNA-binding Lrp family transcriptional regulator
VSSITDLERQVLDRIQLNFPLSSDPYGDIASDLGSTREEIHSIIMNLRESGIIRRLGGIFAANRLGYVSCLVAARVDEDRLEEAAAAAGVHPEVTHNYKRDGEYNLWFTIVAEGDARKQEILDSVRQCKGVLDVQELPALKTFKIKVNFQFGGSKDAS